MSAAPVFAQTIYTINTSSSYPANCSNCTFNIAPGATLTISQAGTCSNCTFNGGIIAVQGTITCQPCSFNNNNITLNSQSINPNSGTTSFQNVVLTAKGASSITANTAVAITNSVFTFNDLSYFNNNGGQLDISNSTLNFFGNSFFNANAGPVNLKNASKLVVGNGLLSSLAYIKINGPALNIYDNASSVVLANLNNYYFNWSSFNSLINGKTYATTYPNAASKLNCGAAGQNACGLWSAPTVYGPAGFTSAGVASVNALLPVVLTDFSISNTNAQVALTWTTAQELNAAYFSVERSTDATSWQKIGQVTAKGNASVATRYSFTDAGPLNTLTYYRLVMVDRDGNKAYSDSKKIHASLVKGISFYPNPAIDKVTISLADADHAATTIQLLNQAGQVLQQETAAANSSLVALNVQQYPRGLYLLKVSTADGTAQTSKLMIAR